MAIQKEKKVEDRPDLTPMIDVVFQLLIFFVVTTTFLSDTGIPLDLPEAGTGQQESMRPEMSVRIAADGSIRFQGEMVSLADLEQRLQRAREASPQEALTIYGDGRVDLETIVKVMDLARRVKVPGLVLATQEPVVPPAP